eukprot:TRINITY_DN3112_c0_g1_i1.p1 TRINITY_DN3112_c0_g1~~TRINITY_DN3112_c0_g1_i1.p1  ORF type:complete len:381 (-),score=38.67 TRINITY_DN3112_c0_g1_i1:94-1236(-)
MKLLGLVIVIFATISYTIIPFRYQAKCPPQEATLKKMVDLAKADSDSVAIWTFDSPTDQCEFVDQKNGFVLQRAGNQDNLVTGKEYVNSGPISFVDFSQGDVILYADPTNIESQFTGSFSMVVIFNTNGSDLGGAFLAGKWEEYDRSRSFALFGSLFDGALTAHVSLNGKASPPRCDFARDEIHLERVIDHCWHTGAIVWRSNPKAEPFANKEELDDCIDPPPSVYDSFYECDENNSLNCSALEVHLDNLTARTKHFKYQSIYIGTNPFQDHPNVDASIKRRAMFTVGGGMAKHCKQPDSSASDINHYTTAFGGSPFNNDYTQEERCSSGYPSDNWNQDFIQEQFDWFLRSRFRGKIAGIFLFKRALTQAEIKYYTFFSC